jgi:hypothetical protein
MLDLSPAHDTLNRLHRLFQDSSLPGALSAEAFARFDRSTYAPHVLERGCRAWQLRVLDEYRSQVAFSELLMELTELGASFDTLGAAIRVVRDEGRHVELCRRMVVALGGTDQMPGEPQWVRSDPSAALLTRILRTTVGFLCIGETLSAELIIAAQRAATDGLAKAVLGSMAADEALHGRFGWMLLDLLLPHLDEVQRNEIDRRLAPEFKNLEQLLSSCQTPGPRPSQAFPFGAVSPERGLKIFERCLTQKVIPALQTRGFRAEQAWNSCHP